MKLVIGGAEQGKREAACRLFGCELSDFADGRSCDLTAIESCRAISCFHMYLLRRLRADDLPQPNGNGLPDQAAFFPYDRYSFALRLQQDIREKVRAVWFIWIHF